VIERADAEEKADAGAVAIDASASARLDAVATSQPIASSDTKNAN